MYYKEKISNKIPEQLCRNGCGGENVAEQKDIV